MSNSINIRLKDFYNESISSRDAIALVFNRKFDPEQNVIIDFSEIIFITRSATHQLIKEIERLQERFKCNVTITSTNDEVALMLKIVKEAQLIDKTKKSEVEQVTFDNDADLNKFLLSF